MSQSGSVRAMPAARMQSSAPPPAMAVAPVIAAEVVIPPPPAPRGGRVHLKSNLPTAIGVGLQQPIPQPARQQPVRPPQQTSMQPQRPPVQAVHVVPSVQVGPMQRSVTTPPNGVGPTVVDQAPMIPSGAYRIVNPGDSIETVRARMIEMGLDPNARSSIIPQPPPRRATGQAPAAAPQTALLQPVQPNAIVRRAR